MSEPTQYPFHVDENGGFQWGQQQAELGPEDRPEPGRFVSALAEHAVPSGWQIQAGRIGEIADVQKQAITVYWGHSTEGEKITTCYNLDDFYATVEPLPGGRGAAEFAADRRERGLEPRANGSRERER